MDVREILWKYLVLDTAFQLKFVAYILVTWKMKVNGLAFYNQFSELIEMS